MRSPISTHASNPIPTASGFQAANYIPTKCCAKIKEHLGYSDSEFQALQWSSDLMYKNIQWSPCLTSTPEVVAASGDVLTVVFAVVGTVVLAIVAAVLCAYAR